MSRGTTTRVLARTLVGGGVALVGAVVLASPAAAHGVGSRGDLPLPIGIFAWSAGLAVACSFLAFGVFWNRPVMARAATGHPLPGWFARAVSALAVVVRVLVVALWALTLLSALLGDENPLLNFSPWAVYIVFWVGVQIVSVLLGPFWGAVSPFDTIVGLAERLGWKAPRAGADNEPSSGFAGWVGVAGLLSFLWLELAYFESATPSAIGIWLAGYSLVMVLGGLVFGRRWLRTGDGFVALFDRLGHIGPFFRDAHGDLRIRVPGSGLSAVRIDAAAVLLILVTLGSTTFDGITRQSWWEEADFVATALRWERTVVHTLGLLLTIAVMAVLYYGAIRVMAWYLRRQGQEYSASDLAEDFAPSLLPIAFAYAVAHYFSLLMFDGQRVIPRLSDPFGNGSDWFGTADYAINFTYISTDLIAWVQALAIALGHIAGVAAAHDRALERMDRRFVLGSQIPLVVVMIGYTVGGLLLLLGA
ncbi:MAG: hypothetical protein ACR2QE_17660 [Acidimicrobiales bacterium]